MSIWIRCVRWRTTSSVFLVFSGNSRPQLIIDAHFVFYAQSNSDSNSNADSDTYTYTNTYAYAFTDSLKNIVSGPTYAYSSCQSGW